MSKQTSLTRSFYIRLLLGIIVSILLTGGIWLASGYHQLRTETEFLLGQARQHQRESQKEYVQMVLDLIEHERQFAQAETRETVRQRTLEAHNMMTQLVLQNQDHYPPEKLQEIIKSSLRSIRYNHGRGYFFAINMDGTEELYPPEPQLEGTRFLGSRNEREQTVIKDMIRIARDQGEGYYDYSWPKPDPAGSPEPAAKTAYIKYFEPFNWIIGTGEYHADVIADLQSNLVDRIEKIRFDGNNYIFGATYEGIGLTYPAKGRNMYDVTDSNGLKIVQELIRLAKSGGGYLNYVMPPLKGERPEPKISYVAAVPDWQWYIGTGDFVADLDQEISAMLATQRAAMRYKIAALAGILCVFVFVGWRVSKKQEATIASSFRTFQEFFDRSARTNQPLVPGEQTYQEFGQLAESANLMLEKRQHFEEEARRYRDQLLNIIDAMPSILAAVDHTGRVIHWNKYASEHSGIAQQQAIGQNIAALLPYLRDLLPDILHSCGDQQTFQHNLLIRDNGSNCNVNVSAYPLSSTQPLQLVVRIDDVTAQARIEEMMVQTEKMLSIGGLAAGLAHEINNPLSIISQAAQNATRRLSPSLPANQAAAAELGIDLEKLGRYLDRRGITSFLTNIGHAVERSAQIIQNMLNFTATSASEREPCSVDTLISNALEMAWNDYDLKKKYNFRQVAIDRHIPDNLPGITVNRIELEQVFFNLLKNAGQAMAEVETRDFQPRIRVSAESDSENVIIKIDDNGPGMPDTVKTRIFEPFFTTKEIGVGTGLGLSVAYFIVVKRHKGQFLVDSALGQGTTFSIVLPRSKSS